MSATERKPPATFEDLKVYQIAREFRKAMYRVARRLPDVERFGLASRRAAVSLTNNIAEGHGRYHYLDQIKFTLQARGSLEELIDGYIRYLREQKKAAGSSSINESSVYGAVESGHDSRFSI